MTYDIFISYRRDGGEDFARQIQLALENYGYKVFLDFDACDDGSFEQKIKVGIKESPIFMLILSHGALERCVNEDDWVRKEIEYAVELKKKIIPINPDKTFDNFPEGFPTALRDYIGSHQISDIPRGQLFKASLDMLVKRRINEILPPRKKISVPHATHVTKIILSLIVVAVVLCIGLWQYQQREELEVLNKDKNAYFDAVHKADSLRFVEDSLLYAKEMLKEAQRISHKYSDTPYKAEFYEPVGSLIEDVDDRIDSLFEKYKTESIKSYSSYKSNKVDFAVERLVALHNIDKALNLRNDDDLLKIKQELLIE